MHRLERWRYCCSHRASPAETTPRLRRQRPSLLPLPQLPPLSPTPTPVPSPTPTEQPQDLLEAALLKTIAEGFAFERNAGVQTERGSFDVPITNSGDQLSFYTSADLVATLPDRTIESEIVLLDLDLYSAGFFFDRSTQTGSEGRVQSALLRASILFPCSRSRRNGIRRPADHRRHRDARRVRQHLKRSTVQGEITARIGAEDGLLLEVEASGTVDIGGSATSAFGSLTSDTASFTLTWELFDHGQEITAVLPELALPTFSHAATALDDGRVLVSGGFTGIANNNVIAPFPLPFTQVYDPVAETWTYIEPLEGHSRLNSTVKLRDGRVLLVGIRLEDGIAGLASTFDPVEGSSSYCFRRREAYE